MTYESHNASALVLCDRLQWDWAFNRNDYAQFGFIFIDTSNNISI